MCKENLLERTKKVINYPGIVDDIEINKDNHAILKRTGIPVWSTFALIAYSDAFKVVEEELAEFFTADELESSLIFAELVLLPSYRLYKEKKDKENEKREPTNNDPKESIDLE